MTAVWLKLITMLCLFCKALSGQEGGGTVWRDVGGTVTIQCRSDQDQELLNLKKGLSEDVEVLAKDKDSEKNTVAKEFTDRLQVNGIFPSIDILIKNLTTDDTGPYWCFYTKFDAKSQQANTVKGTGSVLLVVTDTVQQCLPQDKSLVLVSVGISAVVLFGIIMAFLIWILPKTKALRSSVKPRRGTTNDVYEDMRGTLKR